MFDADNQQYIKPEFLTRTSNTVVEVLVAGMYKLRYQYTVGQDTGNASVNMSSHTTQTDNNNTNTITHNNARSVGRTVGSANGSNRMQLSAETYMTCAVGDFLSIEALIASFESGESGTLTDYNDVGNCIIEYINQ